MKKLLVHAQSVLTICFFLSCSSMHAHEVFIEKSSLPDNPRDLYIDLIKRALVNTIYEDPAWDGPYTPRNRLNGLDWPSVAHTMVGTKRLNNIHDCLKSILENDVPGDCIETGVWRGGCTILMRAILKAYNDNEKQVWVVDSFTGLPSQWNQNSYLTVSMEQVMSNFDKYGLLDNQVVFAQGLFSQTLPRLPIHRIALLRLDGDYYQSTWEALMYLYPKLSKGGFIIIDDYGSFEGCRDAVAKYRKAHNITDPIMDVDGIGAYWQKSTP